MVIYNTSVKLEQYCKKNLNKYKLNEIKRYLHLNHPTRTVVMHLLRVLKNTIYTSNLILVIDTMLNYIKTFTNNDLNILNKFINNTTDASHLWLAQVQLPLAIAPAPHTFFGGGQPLFGYAFERLEKRLNRTT